MKNIKFLKMKWKGLYSFGLSEQTFEFRPGFHLIVGRNGSGKSSFMNILSLCLFDKSPSLNKREALNDQYDQGEVLLSMTVDSVYYEIFYARNKSEIEWQLNKRPESGIMTKVIDGKDTGRYIEQLLGFDYNQFVNAFYLTQSGSTSMRLVFGSPAERLDILSKLFGLNKYELASDLASAKSVEFAKMVVDIEVKVLGKEAEIRGIGSVEEDLKVGQETLERLKKEEDEFIGIDEKIDVLKVEKEELRKEKQGLYDIEMVGKDSINKLKIEQVRTDDEIKKLKELVDLFALYQSEKGANSEDERKRQVLKDGLNETMKEKDEIGKLCAVLKSQVQDLAGREKKLMKGEGRCDQCGSSVTGDQLRTFKEEITNDRREKEKSCNVYEAQLGGLQTGLKLLEKELAEVEERIKKFERKYDRVREFDIDTEQRFNAARQKHDEVVKQIDDLNSASSRNDERRKKIEFDLSCLEEKIDGLKFDLTRLAAIKKEEELVAEQIRKRELDRERIKKIGEELVSMNEQKIVLVDKVDGYKFWVKGFKDLEILTLCGLVNGINSKIEETLSRFGMVCWLAVLEEKKGSKSGLSLDDFKRKVNIFVKAEGKDHVPIEGYSGGEKQLIALGLILAMGSVVSECNFLGLDEVFGSLDEANRGSVIQLLEEERERGLLEGKTVLVVSHDEDIKAGIDWDSITLMDKTEKGTVMKRLK